MESEEKKLRLVTSTTDLFNSADGSGFFVARGEVKELPEELTPIIEDAIEQGILIEPSPEDISKHEWKQGMEKALRERKFSAGDNYEETVKRYQKYLDVEKEKEDKKMAEEEKKQEDKNETIEAPEAQEEKEVGEVSEKEEEPAAEEKEE